MRRWWWAGNGQGKTNLLEAVYFLVHASPAACESALRVGALRDRAVARDRTIHPQWRGAGDLGARSSAGLRQAFVDGKKAAKLEDYFGGVSVVAFTPDDLAVVKGGPELRRAFLDRAVFNRFPAYLREHRAYQRAAEEPEPAAQGARAGELRRGLRRGGGPDRCARCWFAAVRSSTSSLPGPSLRCERSPSCRTWACGYAALHLGAHHPRTEDGLRAGAAGTR